MVASEDPVEPSAAEELLARSRDGETQAFCLLIKPLQARLLRQAFALSGDASAAEDLVSETLVEAWKSLAHYNETCQLCTWLYSILLHRYQKAVRRSRSRPPSLAWLPFREAKESQEQQKNIPSPGLSPAEAATQSERFAQLRQSLKALPEKHRQIILLRFFGDASLSDMAMIVGCSIGAVKSRLHHALEKLRKIEMNLSDLRRDKQL